MRCRTRVLTWGLFFGGAAAVLAPIGPGALIPLKLAIASADTVGNDVYVAVVVDFGNGSSTSTITKCVPVAASARDSDALAAVVGQGNVAYSNSGLLCAIDNYPANGVQQCGQSVGSGNYDYWSYWHGSTGSWVYASDGPTEQSVASPADDVEGLRFQVKAPDNSTDPPPGGTPTYAQICNAATEVPPAQSPASASTTTTTPPPPVTTTTTSRALGEPGATLATTTTKPKTAAGAKSGSPSSTTTSTSGSATAGGAGSGERPTSRQHSAALASAASHHDAGGSSSPLLPIVLVVAVVAVLGGFAFFRWRRRPAEE